MRLLSYIGYIFLVAIGAVLGNLLWAVISVEWADRIQKKRLQEK